MGTGSARLLTVALLVTGVAVTTIAPVRAQGPTVGRSPLVVVIAENAVPGAIVLQVLQPDDVTLLLQAVFPPGLVDVSNGAIRFQPSDSSAAQIFRQLIADLDQPASSLRGRAVAAYLNCLTPDVSPPGCRLTLEAAIAQGAGTAVAPLAALLLGQLALSRGDPLDAVAAYAALLAGPCLPTYFCATALWYQGLAFEALGRAGEAQDNYQRLLGFGMTDPAAARWPVVQLAAERLTGQRPLLPPPPPIILPPPPPPVVVPVNGPAGGDGLPVAAEVPAIPEADSGWLVALGLIGVALLIYRRRS